ncbi:MAG: TraB/GumN family protein [Clostridia bacterium]|nr:TraB/GumN family protein [Clostridia bacterium]
MKKRTLSLILAFLLFLAAASGCAKKGNGAETAPAGKTPLETEAPPSGLPETGGADPAPEAAFSPALWRVTDGQHALYLLGTIHVGDERSEDALAAVRDVFDGCDALAVEFDTVAFENDLAASVAAVQQFLYTDGTTVRDHLPEELYEKSLEIIKSGGEYSKLIEKYNLAIWSQFLEQAAIVPSGLTPDYGMDGLLLDRAYDRGMKILEVESAEFQYGLINSFSEELYVLMIEDTVDSIDGYCDDLVTMYEAWLGGDAETLEDYVIGTGEDGEDEEDLTEEQIGMLEDYDFKMLDERNLGMADKAEAYLKSGDTVFFAVGAAHMLGDGGLVKLLTDKGYEVTRMDPPYLITKDA